MKQLNFSASTFLFSMSLIVSCISSAQVGSSDLCRELKAGCSIEKFALSGPLDSEDQYLLKVTLGKLTESQFQNLQVRYSSPQMPSFDPSRIYSLADFLPAFIQQTNGKVLVPHTLKTAPELLKALQAQGKTVEPISYVDANCHSVTWQWINYLQGRGVDEALFTRADGEQFELDGRIAAQDIQAGDVLLVKGTGGYDQVDAILHSAVYLGNGLVFEKGNPGQDYPFRLGYLNDVIAKFKNVDGNAEFQFYRVQLISKILPTLSEELSLITPLNQQAASLDLSALPPSLLSQYVLQETWDKQKGESVFTLGRIVTSSQVSAQKLLNAP